MNGRGRRGFARLQRFADKAICACALRDAHFSLGSISRAAGEAKLDSQWLPPVIVRKLPTAVHARRSGSRCNDQAYVGTYWGWICHGC
ncbi:MAG: hypothetical protein HZB38_05580 [Planctomycetes bacterium]|nr:hypothetical protein [Planctomycetota bacterium]